MVCAFINSTIPINNKTIKYLELEIAPLCECKNASKTVLNRNAMASNQFESALTSLLKPQEEKSQLLKILAEIAVHIEGPNRKTNIGKLCEQNCLESVITSLQQPHLDILDVTLNILGNCCREQTCARDAVRQYNLLSYLNHTLKHYKEDSIQGRIFGIIGNICQHCDELTNAVVENESELELVAKIVTFLNTVAQVDDGTGATICLAIRALQELANGSTVGTLITDCRLVNAIGLLLIKFTPGWQRNKQHTEILQIVLKLLYKCSKYNTNYDIILELQNTDEGNAMVPLGILVQLSPITVAKIIVNLNQVCKSGSELFVNDLIQILTDQLQNSAYFRYGRADPMHRDYLQSISLLIECRLKAKGIPVGLIPTLLLVLEDHTEVTDIALKNSILIIAILRNLSENPLLISMLKQGIVNILSEKLNLVLGPDVMVDISHNYKSEKYGCQQRIRYAVEVGNIFPCSKGEFSEGFENSKPTLSELHRMSQGVPSSSSDYLHSSGFRPDFSSLLTRAKDLVGRWGSRNFTGAVYVDSGSGVEDWGDLWDLSWSRASKCFSDSDGGAQECIDDSSFCSDTDDEPSVPLSTIKEGDEDPADDNEIDGQPPVPDLHSRKLLSKEIVKLVQLFTNIRPVAMELTNGDLLTKLLMLLLPANNIICPPNTLKVIERIVRTSESLIDLMQTDFIGAVYKFTITQHQYGCTTCTKLNKAGKTILAPFSHYVEDISRFKGIAYMMMDFSSAMREKLVTAIPFCTLTKRTLQQLMNAGGLDCLLRLFREQLILQQTSVYRTLCVTALKLGIKNPTMEAKQATQMCLRREFYERQGNHTKLPMDIENYKLEANCDEIVCFKLDDGSCVQADRDFLSLKSVYFNRLLSGQFKESCEQEIKLGNVRNESLKCLLMLLKYDLRSCEMHQIDVKLEVLLDVISLTDRYLMEGLCSYLAMSVQCFKFLPTNIPIIYQWALESGTDILREKCVAYALVAEISESERLTMFQNLLELGYSDELANDINILLRQIIRFYMVIDSQQAGQFVSFWSMYKF